MAVPAQVVAGKIHQHHVLGILLGIVAQILGILLVCLGIARTLGGSRNGIDVGPTAFNTTMGFRTGSEDAEAAKVEIEQVRTWIDAAQCPVEFEVIALIALFESSGEDYLEHIASQTVSNTFAYVLTMFIIGKGAPVFSHGVEVVCLVGTSVNVALQDIQVVFFTLREHFNKCKLIAEVVKDDDILIKNV